MRASEPGGTLRRSRLTAGASYFRPAGVEHDVINDNDFEFVFVEIEGEGRVSPTAFSGAEECQVR
jgi:hypothetical protein